MSDYTNAFTNLKTDLFEYQKAGVEFMLRSLDTYGFTLNADDVGLGKTIQTLAVLQHYVNTKDIKRILIVCKKSIKNQWRSEINKFTNLSETFFTYVTKENRDYARCLLKSNFILITNYHTFLYDAEILREMNFDIVIVDEAHSVKACQGKMNNAIKIVSQPCPYVILLTGTPVMSKAEDLYGIVSLATDKYFGDYEDFMNSYCIRNTYRGEQYVAGYCNIEDLHNKVTNFLIRRLASDTDIDLPNIVLSTESVCIGEPTCAALAFISYQRFLWQRRLNDLQKLKNLTSEQQTDVIKLEAALKGLISIEQIVCNDITLLPESSSPLVKNLIKSYSKHKACEGFRHGEKNPYLVDLVTSILDAGDNKIIIFSKFETCVNKIAQVLEKELNIKTLTYSGSVNDTERNKNVELFNNAEYPILIGTDAMAEGLNLQVANFVINYDQPDTDAVKVQRVGRARRVGSNAQCVFVYDLIATDSYGFISDYLAGFNNAELEESLWIPTPDERILNKLNKQVLLSDAILANKNTAKMYDVINKEKPCVCLQDSFVIRQVTKSDGNTVWDVHLNSISASYEDPLGDVKRLLDFGGQKHMGYDVLGNSYFSVRFYKDPTNSILDSFGNRPTVFISECVEDILTPSDMLRNAGIHVELYGEYSVTEGLIKGVPIWNAKCSTRLEKDLWVHDAKALNTVKGYYIRKEGCFRFYYDPTYVFQTAEKPT